MFHFHSLFVNQEVRTDNKSLFMLSFFAFLNGGYQQRLLALMNPTWRVKKFLQVSNKFSPTFITSISIIRTVFTIRFFLW